VPHINIEIKARCADPGRIRNVLKSNHADYKGTDYQIDTYFNVPRGRLKLRQSNIENSLIFYSRANQTGPKEAQVCIYRPEAMSSLKELLTGALHVLVTVRKKREIYFIENVKFHIDQVENLGAFVEIEAIGTTHHISKEKLRGQCEQYMRLLAIAEEDLIDCSYSDLLMQKGHKPLGGD